MNGNSSQKEETEKKEEKVVEEDKPAEKKAEVEEKPSITFPTLNIDMNRLNSDTGNTFRWDGFVLFVYLFCYNY